MRAFLGNYMQNVNEFKDSKFTVNPRFADSWMAIWVPYRLTFALQSGRRQQATVVVHHPSHLQGASSCGDRRCSAGTWRWCQKTASALCQSNWRASYFTIARTMFPKPNLIGLPVIPDQSFCRLESITSCTSDRMLPITSSRICSMHQPSVDWFR